MKRALIVLALSKLSFNGSSLVSFLYIGFSVLWFVLFFKKIKCFFYCCSDADFDIKDGTGAVAPVSGEQGGGDSEIRTTSPGANTHFADRLQSYHHAQHHYSS